MNRRGQWGPYVQTILKDVEREDNGVMRSEGVGGSAKVMAQCQSDKVRGQLAHDARQTMESQDGGH